MMLRMRQPLQTCQSRMLSSTRGQRLSVQWPTAKSRHVNCNGLKPAMDDMPSCSDRNNTDCPNGPLQLLPTGALALAMIASLSCPAASLAFEIQAEPANALSLPTWAIHVSSVLEWVTAMGLFWKYAEVTGNERWKGMTWGMLPSLGSAMCACTWHFFYNAPSLEILVAVQAFLTVVGNTTCWIAAYRVYEGAQEENKSA